MPSNMREVVERYLRVRAQVRELQAIHGDRAAQMLDNWLKEILGILGRATQGAGPAVADEGQLRRLRQEMDEALDRLETAAAAAYRDAFRNVESTMREGMILTYSGGVSGISERAIRRARRVYDTTLRSDLFNEGFSQWVGRFRDANGSLVDSIKASVGRGFRNGWDQRRLAADLLNIPEFNFQNLPAIGERGERIFTMGGTLGQSDALVRRANVIARTEMTATVTAVHTEWTQRAGFDRYINVNDEPVALECKEANQQEPMTLEEWKAWRASNGRGGLAPRHPNCDSLPLAVPVSYRGTGAFAERAA